MANVTVGIDLAKNVFAVHGVNDAGKPELVRLAVARGQLHESIAALPPRVIGMEACSGAHHWARMFQDTGHTVRLIAPKFVTPYRMSGGDLRGRAAPAHALRADQESGATVAVDGAPGASGLCRAAHGRPQPHSWQLE